MSLSPLRSVLATSTAILFALPLITGQTTSLLPNTLPACAATCPLVIQAQAACGPTVATGQDALKSCFCQSAYLAPIYAANTNICAPQCADADFSSISTWFKGFCAAGSTGATNNGGSANNGGAAAANPAANPAADPTTTTATTASASATAAAANGEAGLDTPMTGNQW